MKSRLPHLCTIALLAACSGGSGAGTGYLDGVGRIPGAKSVGVELQADGILLTAPGVQGPLVGARATGNRLLVIGDSILAGTANRYGGEMCKALVPLGWRTAVEAEAGRPASFGREVLSARLSEGWDAAVVFLGTNPSSSIERYEKDMLAVVDALSPRPVLLLTTTLFRATQKPVNDVIRGIAASHDNVSVLDWGTASGQPGVLNRDGVHPTTLGRALLVKAVAASVGNAPVAQGQCMSARFEDDSRVTGVMPPAVAGEQTTVPAQSGTVPATTAGPGTTTTAPPATTTTVSVTTTTAPPATTTSRP